MSAMNTPSSNAKPKATEADRERGRRIAKARTKIELTQAELADKIGVSAGLVGQWETGSTGLTPKKAALLERVLKVSMTWLLTGNDPDQTRRAQTETELEQLALIRSVPIENQEKFLEIVRSAAKAFSKKET
ncbi:MULTISPECIES: helix-turn-helix domain-containing protein [Acetobacter]|uniref:helix-turn-helix domain-containing protein n=1 Tax=Acetobacter TaxID=434 RepID=UPI00248D431A|nr:helix-turn-helix domain-containing protein [Acetobacter malorum]